jgi:hypothetical protein
MQIQSGRTVPLISHPRKDGMGKTISRYVNAKIYCFVKVGHLLCPAVRAKLELALVQFILRKDQPLEEPLEEETESSGEVG